MATKFSIFLILVEIFLVVKVVKLKPKTNQNKNGESI